MRRPVATTLIVIVAAAASSNPVESSTDHTIASRHSQALTEEAGPSSRSFSAIPGRAEPGSVLESFDDCDQLLDHIQSEALRRVGAYGLDLGQYGRSSEDDGRPDDFPGDGLEDDPGDRFLRDLIDKEFTSDADEYSWDEMDVGPPMDMPGDAPAGAGVEFSGTNVQVAGVDEPDIVKTDGRRIITVSQNVLTVVDVTGDAPTVVGHVLLDEAPDGELLLHGDRALAIRNDSGSIRPATEVGEGGLVQPEIVVIDEVLLDGVPHRGRTLRIEGRYVSSRSIGGTARIVVNSIPGDPGFVRPLNRAGIPIARDANRQVVEQTTLSDWLPDYTLTDAAGSVLEQTERLLACDRVHVPNTFGGFGTSSVLTVDLDEPLAPDAGAATFAAAETVYATPENLYVATSAWVPSTALSGSEITGAAGERYATSIHKFSLRTDGPAGYEASGSIRGHLLNQFALHERDDHLFVAVTEGPPRRFRGTASRIVALRQQGDALVEVGAVGDLGRDERIFAVRYIADRAYVVTFREIDPLYIIDLSDPTRLAVLGELKIPGFSSYLHPIGDGLLIGVGRDITPGGWDRGLKISLFDISDATNPRELDAWTLDDARTEVGVNHRSFLWWGPERLMVLPVFPRWSNAPSGALAFEVTRSGGLTELGLIEHGPARNERVRRSLVIGEDLWTMSASLLQRNDIETLQRDVRVPLPARDEMPPDDSSAPAVATGPDGDTGTDEVAPQAADEPHTPASVTRFADCTGLLDHIRTEAVSHVGAYGFERGRFGRPSDRSGDTVDPDSRWVTVTGDRTLHDFIDSDGRRIVTTVGDMLTVTDITDAGPSVVGRLPLDLDRTSRLLMNGNRVLVIGEKGANGSRGPEVAANDPFDRAVVVREFILGDQLRRGRSLYIEGRLLEARSNAGRARIVVRTTPPELGLVRAITKAGEGVAAARNRHSIEGSTLETWLPRYSLVSDKGLLLSEGQLLSCDEVAVTSEFSGVGLVSALTINPDRSITPGKAVAIFGEDVATLATGESLYVATEPWPAPPDDDSGDRSTARDAPASTTIHRFTLNHWWRAAYEASGSFAGTLIGPSPLHEHRGRLFAAVEERVSGSGDKRHESRIVALERNGDRLASVGQSDDISDRYPVTVVRYTGDRAFTHTGRFSDPVRVVDLHNPTKPSPAGELSTLSLRHFEIVLNPAGNDQLLTVERDSWRWERATKISSYVVSDGEFREAGSWTLAGFTSRTTLDPESLLWSDQVRILVVPVAETSDRDRTSGAAVLRVDPAGNLAYIGHVGSPEHRADISNAVFRSLTIGDDLWTLSASYSREVQKVYWWLQSNDVNTLERRAALVLNS